MERTRLGQAGMRTLGLGDQPLLNTVEAGDVIRALDVFGGVVLA